MARKKTIIKEQAREYKAIYADIAKLKEAGVDREDPRFMRLMTEVENMMRIRAGQPTLPY